jgi:hypothetical protein
MRFLKDLIITDTFIIKGHANTGGQRLSTFLNSTRKRFLEMEEAMLVKHDGSSRVAAGWLQVQVNDILFAHELEDSGDEGLRHLSERNKDDYVVTAYFGGSLPLQLHGMVRQHALDSGTLRDNDFIVVVAPRLAGLAISALPEYALIENLPYAIVNKNRLALIFR